MRTGTMLTPTALMLSGLLMLAGVFSDTRPALAQLDCPLPDGVTPPADPAVTAQQVEEGSANLTDFALAARDFISSPGRITNAGQVVYFGCLTRQEGSPWRSGSTYLVRLLPDGRVFIHSKAMSLSGRLLTPVIYRAILEALGIDPAALTDPAATRAAFTAAAGRGWRFVQRPRCPGRLRLRHRISLGRRAAPVRAARRIRSQCVSPGSH